MNVVFVNYLDFTSNSAVHIFNLANELTGLGVGCAVAVPGDADTIALHRRRRASRRSTSATRGAARSRFPDGGPPTLVHGWTPREVVRELDEELAARHGCPYLVHLEDNEDVITADSLGLTVEELHAAPAASSTRRSRRGARTRRGCGASSPARPGSP